MSEFRHQQPEQRYVVEGKEEREKSVTLVVYDALAKAWGNEKWEEVNFAHVQAMFRAVYDHASAELKIDEMPHKLGLEYKNQMIEAIIDHVQTIIPEIQENDQLVETVEYFAKGVPEERQKILRTLLNSLESTPEQKWNRFKVARTLMDSDAAFFSELKKFGFSQKDQIDLARRVAGKLGLNIFEFIASTGLEIEEFREAIFIQLSEGNIAYIVYKKFSPTEAFEYIQQTKEYLRDEVRRMLNVPKRNFETQDKVNVGVNEFEEEFPISVEHMRSLGDELSRVIAEANPERTIKMESDRKREQALFQPIVGAAEMSSKTSAAPVIVYLEGNDVTPAIYKPQRRDKVGVRFGISPGTYAQREWLAYQIDRSFGLDITPATVLRDGPDGIGSVQEWVVAKTIAAAGQWRTEENSNQVEDVAFDDVVKHNRDRHGGNLLVGYDGSLHAIDHGLILATDLEFHLVKSEALEGLSGDEPSDRIKKKIDTFRTSPAVQSVLRSCFDAALGTEAENAWKRFENGLNELLPMDGSDGVYPESFKGIPR